jgi:hypothetical protein
LPSSPLLYSNILLITVAATFVSFSGRIRTGTRSDHNKSSQTPRVTSSGMDEGRTHPAAPWVRAPNVWNTFGICFQFLHILVNKTMGLFSNANTALQTA